MFNHVYIALYSVIAPDTVLITLPDFPDIKVQLPRPLVAEEDNALRTFAAKLIYAEIARLGNSQKPIPLPKEAHLTELPGNQGAVVGILAQEMARILLINAATEAGVDLIGLIDEQRDIVSDYEIFSESEHIFDITIEVSIFVIERLLAAVGKKLKVSLEDSGAGIPRGIPRISDTPSSVR